MKNLSDYFTRTIAVLLLVTFTVLSCSSPVGSGSGPGTSPVVITPGEGDPRFVYLDSSGSATDTDAGRTGFFIENNKNAKGVVVISDDSGTEDVVLVRNPHNDSNVVMFFKKGVDFPYRMTITQGTESYAARLSSYHAGTQTYDITFQQGGSFETLKNFVLNDDIFTLYQNDTDLDTSQNRRVGNIVIALGLWGSLAASLEEAPTGIVTFSKGFFSSFVKGVSSVFKAVAVVATVVAYVAVPVIALVSPTAALVIAGITSVVAPVVDFTLATLFAAAVIIDEVSFEPPSSENFTVVNVTHFYEERWIANGEEFHIGQGQDIVFDFSFPERSPPADLFSSMYIYEPGLPTTSNDVYFQEKELTQIGDIIRLKIKRKASAPGFSGDGKVAYAFKFHTVTTVNDSTAGVMYKLLPDEETESLHKDLVVLRFCIDPGCSDYRD
ncbi:MAG: hypothetical protein LBJ31_09620 [Treponema sp.]|jgi:hypothetical protein|nr:hypothetical protein [Treponema sp.]